MVDNEPGVLHRVVGLFAARGYNIESLTVAETDRRSPHQSRITVVTRAARRTFSQQIEAQLREARLHKRRVHNVTADPNGAERELALVKVQGRRRRTRWRLCAWRRFSARE